VSRGWGLEVGGWRLEGLGGLGWVDGRDVNECEHRDRCVWDMGMELRLEVRFMGRWLLARFWGSRRHCV
jgi:hypothetical protein